MTLDRVVEALGMSLEDIAKRFDVPLDLVDVMSEDELHALLRDLLQAMERDIGRLMDARAVVTALMRRYNRSVVLKNAAGARHGKDRNRRHE